MRIKVEEEWGMPYSSIMRSLCTRSSQKRDTSPTYLKSSSTTTVGVVADDIAAAVTAAAAPAGDNGADAVVADARK